MKKFHVNECFPLRMEYRKDKLNSWEEKFVSRFEPMSPMFTIKQLKSSILLTTAPRQLTFLLTVFAQHNKSYKAI